MIIDEIAAYLEAVEVGEVGTDIFVGFAADEETGIQNNIIMVDQTGSVDPDIDMPILKPIVKVLVRNDAYSGGLAKLYQIHHLFDRMVDGTTLVPGGTEIMVVHTLAEPQHQERDDEGRDYFTCTFVFHIRGSDGLGPSPSNSINWGDIEGDIEDQTDLQDALDGKAASQHGHITADIDGLDGAIADLQSGKENALGNGANNEFLRGDKNWDALTKAHVGLVWVDNTADADKPVSTPQQAALDLKQDLDEKGVADGYASLDGSGKVPAAQLPAITITDTFVVASQVAMLALTAETGDVAVRSDQNKTYILKGSNPATLGDWQELLTPTDSVSSVNGRTGVVTGLAENSDLTAHTGNTSNPHSVTKAQVGLGSVDNTADTAKPVSTAQQTALDLKAPIASPTFTGTVSGVTKAMVGLGSADDTADTAKPVSVAQAAAIAVVQGDIDTHEALTVAHGATGAVVGTTNVQTLTNKTLTSPVVNAPTGIVKGDVGLGNVDNTSDATKDAATATLTNKTLTSPVIANIVPGANFVVTQNSISAIVSEESGAVANTLYLKAGKIGIKGVTSPTYTMTFPAAVGNTLGVEAEVAGTSGKPIVFQAGATGAGTANIAGGTVQFKGGAGTGSGASLCQFFTGTTEAAGNTTLQTVSVKMTLNGIGFLGIGTTTPTAKMHLSGAVSAANASTSGILFRADSATITDSTTAASGTVTHTAVNALGTPTLAASNTSVTYTNASTLYINAAPANGTNVTITNPWAIYVAAGVSHFGGAVRMNDLLRLKSYTVAGLPAGTEGDIAYVTDATTPTYLGALTGGGSVRTPVFKNASAWVSF